MKKKISVIKTSGHSLGIILPKLFCDLLQIEKGDKLELEIKDLNNPKNIIITKVKGEQLDEK